MLIFMYHPPPPPTPSSVGLGIGTRKSFGKFRVYIIWGCFYSNITRRRIDVLKKKIVHIFFLYSFMLYFDPLPMPIYWFWYHYFVYWESAFYIRALMKILPYLSWYLRGKVLRHTPFYHCWDFLIFWKGLTFCLISWKPLLIRISCS